MCKGLVILIYVSRSPIVKLKIDRRILLIINLEFNQYSGKARDRHKRLKVAEQ